MHESLKKIEDVALEGITEVGHFWKRMFSDVDGTPSSTRLLMVANSVFVMAVLWVMVTHMVRFENPAILSLWIAALPVMIAALIGLIVTPYTINRGSTVLGTVAGQLGKLRAPQTVNADVAQVVQAETVNENQ